MKISLNWVKQLTEVDIPTDELVSLIGMRLGEVEEVKDLAAIYNDVVIAKVVECSKHPDADKLSVCLIDDGGKNKDVARGDNGLITVVCGAPNVRPDIYVAWLPPGSTVPSSLDDDQPFVLASKELRGVMSSGMIASSAELALSDDHDGILELDRAEYRRSDKGGIDPNWVDVAGSIKEISAFFELGDSFAEVYGLDDVIIDIENKMFTHRPDCFGILGVAREIAGITGKPFKSPDWYLQEPVEGSPADDKLEISIETDKVPRFTARIIEGVTVAPSSLAMQINLHKVGLKPINNIVDATNHYMYMTGQPLHAYDMDKVAARSKSRPTLVARESKTGEKVALLNGKTPELDRVATVIATDKELVGIGGIMGGADTEIDDSSTNVILECASFDMYDIRRTSMHYGLFTDAGNRFNKGQSTHQNLAVVAEAQRFLGQYADKSPHSFSYDTGTSAKSNEPVITTVQFINSRLGSDLSADQIVETLTNVEFEVSISDNNLEIIAPFWRTDIHIPEDIVEEVGRINGYETLPLVLPIRTTRPTPVNMLLNAKKQIRASLAAHGANEALSYSFVPGKLLEGAGLTTDKSFTITNALSPNLEFYRQSVVPSLLDLVKPNIKAGYHNFAVFEIAKVHNKCHIGKDGLPVEIETLGLVTTSRDGTDDQPAFYRAKEYLTRLCSDMGVVMTLAAITETFDYEMTKPFDQTRSAAVNINGALAGIVGEALPAVEASFKLPRSTAMFEVSTEALMSGPKGASRYSPLLEFPSSDQDLTLQVPAATLYGDLEVVLNDVLSGTGLWYDLSVTSIYSPDEHSKNISFRVSLSDRSKTMTTEEVSAIIDSLAEAASKRFKAKKI